MRPNLKSAFNQLKRPMTQSMWFDSRCIELYSNLAVGITFIYSIMVNYLKKSMNFEFLKNYLSHIYQFIIYLRTSSGSYNIA